MIESLRDEFASRAPDPDPWDLCDLMGLDRTLRVGDMDDEEWEDSILQRWKSLDIEERLELLATYSYKYANAMLKVRAST